jgi:hypothetical protein
VSAPVNVNVPVPVRIGLVLALLLVPRAARAEETAAPATEAEKPPDLPPSIANACKHVGPRNVISTQPLALAARGFALSYERFVGPPRFSVVGTAGFRGAALGDYSSSTVNGGIEGRVWVRRDAGFGCSAPAMSGPYFGLHLNTGVTTLTDRTTDSSVGSSLTFTSTIDFGWRWIAFRILEITPSLGWGYHTDVDPRGHLATTVRPALVVGLSVGWIF